jgi:hypothetical protein
MQAVEEKITGALNAHRDAVKRLSTGKGNALSIGERIRGLGVKTKRPRPRRFKLKEFRSRSAISKKPKFYQMRVRAVELAGRRHLVTR